jgi:hypothetical protein
VTEDEAARMIAGISEWDRGLTIFPKGTEWGLRYFGMEPEIAAMVLYRVADELVRQRIPLRHEPPKGIQ